MILKNITTPNGPAQYHVLTQVTGQKPFATVTLHVNCYLDETTYLAGGALMYQYRLGMPATGLSGDLAAVAEAWLITDATSPLQGGAITVDKTDTLENSQARKWAAIKAARDACLSGNFTYDGNDYQVNIGQVTGCVTAAMLAKQGGTEYSQVWTMANNADTTLTADQMIELGLAMLAYIDGIFKTGRTLRAQIYAADVTIETVEAIAWPA